VIYETCLSATPTTTALPVSGTDLKGAGLRNKLSLSVFEPKRQIDQQEERFFCCHSTTVAVRKQKERCSFPASYCNG
jgi:hypothetical protein